MIGRSFGQNAGEHAWEDKDFSVSYLAEEGTSNQIHSLVADRMASVSADAVIVLSDAAKRNVGHPLLEMFESFGHTGLSIINGPIVLLPRRRWSRLGQIGNQLPARNLGLTISGFAHVPAERSEIVPLAVQEFARGVDGGTLPSEIETFRQGTNLGLPTPGAIQTARQLASAALRLTEKPEFFVDEDGALSFDLRLRNGLRVMAELTINDDLDAGFYQDSDDGLDATEVRYLPDATAEELIELFS